MIATIYIVFPMPFATSLSLRHVMKARCSGAVCTVADRLCGSSDQISESDEGGPTQLGHGEIALKACLTGKFTLAGSEAEFHRDNLQ